MLDAMIQQILRTVDWILLKLGMIWNMMVWLVESVAPVVRYLADAFVTFGRWVVQGARLVLGGLVKGIRALLHLKPSQIWAKIKAGYKKFDKWMHWYQDRIQKPIDDLRARVMDLYRKIFRPILAPLETLRSMVRMIRIFNPRLAAALDARLAGLESKIMWPITATLRRLNGISSHIRAMVTSTGLLDRVLLVESMRRDASLIWEVLTNPRSLIYAPSKTLPQGSYVDLHSDVSVYMKTGGGPLGDYIREAHAAAAEVRQGVA